MKRTDENEMKFMLRHYMERKLNQWSSVFRICMHLRTIQLNCRYRTIHHFLSIERLVRPLALATTRRATTTRARSTAITECLIRRSSCKLVEELKSFSLFANVIANVAARYAIEMQAWIEPEDALAKESEIRHGALCPRLPLDVFALVPEIHKCIVNVRVVNDKREILQNQVVDGRHEYVAIAKELFRRDTAVVDDMAH